MMSRYGGSPLVPLHAVVLASLGPVSQSFMCDENAAGALVDNSP